MRRRAAFAICLFPLAFPALAQAAQGFAFAAFNQGALARHAPLPTPAAGDSGSGPALRIDWTNENLIEARGGEALLLDGEAVRVGIAQQWQWGGWRLGAELPLLFTGGGVLDSTIENWHDWFGLPNGGREQRPQDQYRYRYERDGATVFDFGGSDADLGDLRLAAARCGTAGGCMRAMLQLPSGDEARLLGGGLGGALWYEQDWAAAGWSGRLGLGAAGLRSHGPLAELQRKLVPLGWASLGYALSPALAAGVQFYGHGALHDDSSLEALSRAGGQLVFGLSYRAAGMEWQLALQEDLVTQSSPDFVVHLALHWTD